MSIAAKFKERIGRVRTHLTSLDDQPLGKFRSGYRAGLSIFQVCFFAICYY
jgi:hypothetical protein